MAGTFDSVVSREAAWFTSDPPPGWTSNPPPALSSANSGPFDIIQGYLPKEDFRQRVLYISRTRSTQDRLSMGGGFGGELVWRHQIEVTVGWSFEDAQGELETEQQNLDTAIAAILTRITGPLGDKTHNGAFLAVAEGDRGDFVDIRYGDVRQAMANRTLLEVSITYAAYETLVG